MRPRPDITTNHPAITERSSVPSPNNELCFDLEGGQIVIDRKSLIIGITFCVLITGLSMLALTIVLYREYTRRKQSRAAKEWGRKSRYDRRRASVACKNIDDEYSRQYSGCLHQEPENPEMGSDSPIEIMAPERLYEAPAIPPQMADTDRRNSSRLTLFFDQGVGMWLPKQR